MFIEKPRFLNAFYLVWKCLLLDSLPLLGGWTYFHRPSALHGGQNACGHLTKCHGQLCSNWISKSNVSTGGLALRCWPFLFRPWSLDFIGSWSNCQIRPTEIKWRHKSLYIYTYIIYFLYIPIYIHIFWIDTRRGNSNLNIENFGFHLPGVFGGRSHRWHHQTRGYHKCTTWMHMMDMFHVGVVCLLLLFVWLLCLCICYVCVFVCLFSLFSLFSLFLCFFVSVFLCFCVFLCLLFW